MTAECPQFPNPPCLTFGVQYKYCDDFPGSGNCSRCYGTGKNIHLNSDRSDCEECHGSGVCQYCKASQAFEPPLSRRLRDGAIYLLERFYS